MACKQAYLFHACLNLALALLTGILWAAVWWHAGGNPRAWLIAAIGCTLLLPGALYRLWKLYRHSQQRLLFLIQAFENNDSTVHYSETEGNSEVREMNRALNLLNVLKNEVKRNIVQKEKYYELIMDCISSGVLVLNDNRAVYQKNREALRLLGLNVLTHLAQLKQVDVHLAQLLANCRTGDKLHTTFNNERGTVSLSIRVSDILINNEHLRILALNDINSELNEKEIDSWIRLTRVLTHEIMNAVTPITSLSDTLLAMQTDNEEMRNGLQTISTTGKGLLTFVESYRKFTRIPTPAPSLFYVKEFVERMVKLARHQHPNTTVRFHIDIAPDDLILYADESLVGQVLTNLLKNAIQAIEADETLAASAAAGGKPGIIGIKAYCNETEAVLIEVSNNGLPIAPDVAEHIFIPFFTTKENGSGIGLSISRQIMRLSGGSLTLLPGPNTTFVLTFN